MHSDHWNRGAATVSVLLRTRYAFEHLGLQVLYTTVHEDNGAMLQVLARLGYERCGKLPRKFLDPHGGPNKDGIQLYLLPSMLTR